MTLSELNEMFLSPVIVNSRGFIRLIFDATLLGH